MLPGAPQAIASSALNFTKHAFPAHSCSPPLTCLQPEHNKNKIQQCSSAVHWPLVATQQVADSRRAATRAAAAHFCLWLVRVVGVHTSIPIAPAQAHSQVSSATDHLHWHRRSNAMQSEHQHYRSRPSQKRTVPQNPAIIARHRHTMCQRHCQQTGLHAVNKSMQAAVLQVRGIPVHRVGLHAAAGQGAARAASVAKSTGRWNEPHIRRQPNHYTKKAQRTQQEAS